MIRRVVGVMTTTAAAAAAAAAAATNTSSPPTVFLLVHDAEDNYYQTASHLVKADLASGRTSSRKLPAEAKGTSRAPSASVHRRRLGTRSYLRNMEPEEGLVKDHCPLLHVGVYGIYFYPAKGKGIGEAIEPRSSIIPICQLLACMPPGKIKP